MNSGEMEEELKRLEAKKTVLMERLQECYGEVDEWRKKYENLEDEKEKLFEELTEEILNSQDKKKISNLEKANEELKKYVRKLEKQQSNDVSERQLFTKEMATLSKRQVRRRLEAVSSRARKALWFSKQYGLELDALGFKDKEGNQYPLKMSPSSSTSCAPPTPSQTPGPTPTQLPGSAPSAPPQVCGSTTFTPSQASGFMTPTPPQVPGSTHSTPTGTSGAAPPTTPQTPVAVPPVSSLNRTPPL